MHTLAGFIKNSNPITILSVGTLEEDHLALTRILAGAPKLSSVEPQWKVMSAASLRNALPLLKRKSIFAVVCDGDLDKQSWKDLLEELSGWNDPPSVIVSSRLADERLWSEALNRGAWDVVAKPFDANEIIRVLNSAWLHRSYARATNEKSTAAASVAPLAFPQAV